MTAISNHPTAGAWDWQRIGLWALLLGAVCLWRGPDFVKGLRPVQIGPARIDLEVMCAQSVAALAEPSTAAGMTQFVILQKVVWSPAHPEAVDFFQEWSSARFHFDGLPVYGPQDEGMKRYLGVARDPQIPFNEVNAHPPTAVLVALPLARFDFPNACLVWNLFSLAALAVSIGLIVRQLDLRLSPWALLPFLTLALLCDPLQAQVFYAQFNLILLVLIVGAWAADRSGHPGWSGVLLGTAAVIKLYPGFLFLYFLLQRRWSALVMGALTVALWTGLTAAVLGRESYADYVRLVLPHLGSDFRNSWPNLSLCGFWYKLFDGSATGRHAISLWPNPRAALVASAASCLAVVVVYAVAVLRTRSLPERDRAFGLGVMAMLLVSPITWSHYLLLLLLPATLIWISRRGVSGGHWSLCICLAPMWLHESYFWAIATHSPRDTWATSHALPWQSLTWLSVHTYALLGLYVVGLRVASASHAEKLPET